MNLKQIWNYAVTFGLKSTGGLDQTTDSSSERAGFINKKHFDLLQKQKNATLLYINSNNQKQTFNKSSSSSWII